MEDSYRLLSVESQSNPVFPLFFSSPELKARVTFRDRRLSFVNLSVNFSHFHLFLQKHWANFSQSWHKAILVKGIQAWSIEGPRSFSRGDNGQIANIHQQPLSEVQTELAQSILEWKEFKNSGPDLFPKEDNSEINKISFMTLRIYLNIFRTAWLIESILRTK